MTTSEFITQTTEGIISLVRDNASIRHEDTLGSNEYFALMVKTDYKSYLRNYRYFKGKVNLNETHECYDLGIDKASGEYNWYISKSYRAIYNRNRGRTIIVSVSDTSNCIITGSSYTSASNITSILSAPISSAATEITGTGFTTNWSASIGATGYYLDVATDSGFTSYVTGFQNKNVSNVTSYTVSGLSSETDYYYRIRAYNTVGTSSNSETINTTTEDTDSKDYDGNVYTTVIINGQEWIIENYKTTHYADGTPISNITGNADWLADVNGAYCWYNNDISNKADYGALYNGFARDNAHGFVYVKRGGVQESGWRVPSKTDWDNLSAFLGGDGVSGGKLKEVGLTHWANPNAGAVDSVGFSARGGAWRTDSTGEFSTFNENGVFMCAKSSPLYYAVMYWINDNFQRSATSDITGVSVRLVRDI